MPRSIQNPFGATSNSLYRRGSPGSGCKNTSQTSRSHNRSRHPRASASGNTVMLRYRATNRKYKVSGVHSSRTSVPRSASTFNPRQSASNCTGSAAAHALSGGKPSPSIASFNRAAITLSLSIGTFRVTAPSSLAGVQHGCATPASHSDVGTMAHRLFAHAPISRGPAPR